MITLGLTRHTQLLQMLHEDLKRFRLRYVTNIEKVNYLKADVVSKDGGTVTAAPALVVVSLAWVHLTQKEPGLASSLLCVNVTGNREPDRDSSL